MTARTMNYDHTLEITTSPGEDPQEVLRDYIGEVSSQGHEVIETAVPAKLQSANIYMRHDRTLRCSGCRVTMRVYFIDDRMSIFSDFAGKQCQERQMNVLSLLRR